MGIPIGRMQGDYRFSFILPVREEMFRKVPQLVRAEPVLPPAESLPSGLTADLAVTTRALP